MIPRSCHEELVRQAKNHAVSILIGSRQVGKSTLMRMLRDSLPGTSEYFDLENPAHLALFNEGYTSFIRQVKSRLIFIDEFQYCPNISSVFKAIYDLNPELKVYASGSSSLEIQKHLKESLAGRKLERIVYPLSFSEWLRQFDPPVPEIPGIDEIVPVDLRQAYRFRLADFQRYGAMPGLTHLETEIDKREYLDGLYRTYITKDIKSFIKDESVLGFNKLMSYLALNDGG